MDLALKLQNLRNGNDLPEQSILDSLKMNALKTVTPIIVDAVLTSKLDEETFKYNLSTSIKNAIDLQNLIESKIVNTYGPLSEAHKFFYRRSWSLSATSLMATNSKDSANSAVTLCLAFLRNDSNAKAVLNSANISNTSISNFQEAIKKVVSTTSFDAENSYFSQLDSTLAHVAQKVHFALNDIDFGTCGKEAYSLALDGCFVFTDKLISLFKESAHQRQELMRLKSCINHATEMFLTVYATSAKNFPTRFTLETFSIFEEQISTESNFIHAGLIHVVDLISNVLLERQSRHMTLVTESASTKKNTDFELGVLLDALHKPFDLVRGCAGEKSSPVAFYNSLAKSVQNTVTITNYLEKSLNDQICPLGDFEMKFAHRIVWDNVASAIAFLEQNAITHNEQMIKAAINLAVYLNTDLPAQNPVLAKAGLDEHQVNAFRNERDRIYSVTNTNEFNYKKLSVFLVSKLANTLIKMNMFNWGLSPGYTAGYVSTNILRESINIFNYRNSIVVSPNKTELFQSCLSEASSLFINRWKIEANSTLDYSKRSYARGKISLPQAQAVISRVHRNFANDVSVIQENYRNLHEIFSQAFSEHYESVDIIKTLELGGDSSSPKKQSHHQDQAKGGDQ